MWRSSQPRRCRRLRAEVVVIISLSCNLAAQTWAEEPGPAFSSLAKAADAALAHHQIDAALELYRKALSLNPRWFAGWQSLTLLLLDRQEFRQALESSKKLADGQPEKGDGWTLLGVSEYRLAQDQAALAHLLKAGRLPFDNPTLRSLEEYHFALLLILRSDFDSALKILNWASSHGLKSEELIEALGLAALRIAERPGQANPAKQKVILEAGRIQVLIAHKEFDRAQAGFEKLLTTYANMPGLHYAYGNFLAQQGRFDDAFAAFRTELQFSPDDTFVLLQLAVLATKQSRQDVALEYCRQAIERDPRLFAGYLIEGKILLQQGKIDKALLKLQLAARLAPASFQVHVALMNAFLSAGRHEDAAREREILRKLDERETAIVRGLPGDVEDGPHN